MSALDLMPFATAAVVFLPRFFYHGFFANGKPRTGHDQILHGPYMATKRRIREPWGRLGFSLGIGRQTMCRKTGRKGWGFGSLGRTESVCDSGIRRNRSFLQFLRAGRVAAGRNLLFQKRSFWVHFFPVQSSSTVEIRRRSRRARRGSSGFVFRSRFGFPLIKTPFDALLAAFGGRIC